MVYNKQIIKKPQYYILIRVKNELKSIVKKVEEMGFACKYK